MVKHPLLSRIAACTGLHNLFSAIVAALSILYLVRDLELDPGVIGLVFSGAAVGGLVGAVSAGQLAKRFGSGPIIPLSALLFGPFSLLMPLASFGPPVPLLIVGGFGVSFSVVLYNVAQVSLRQRVCPPRLIGRMNATIRFLVWGTLPIGAFAGGLLGNAFSILTALWIAAFGSFLAALPVVFSPLIGMRELPDAVA